jgi:hypothetical protein
MSDTPEIRIKLLIDSDDLSAVREAFIKGKPLPHLEDWQICWIGHDREKGYSFAELKKKDKQP